MVRLNEALLDAIRADCRERRTPVLFVYIPTRTQRKFDTLRSYMDEHGAHFIDPTQLPSMSAELYYPIDGHLNAEGHALLAGVILDWIRANLAELAGAPGGESSGD